MPKTWQCEKCHEILSEGVHHDCDGSVAEFMQPFFEAAAADDPQILRARIADLENALKLERVRSGKREKENDRLAAETGALAAMIEKAERQRDEALEARDVEHRMREALVDERDRLKSMYANASRERNATEKQSAARAATITDHVKQILALERELKATRAAGRLAAKSHLDAQAKLDDIEDAYRIVIDEKCAPDEKHCTCVPHLRRRVAELEAEVRHKPISIGEANLGRVKPPVDPPQSHRNRE